MRVWDAATGQLDYSSLPFATAAAWDPEGEYIAYANPGRTFTIIDPMSDRARPSPTPTPTATPAIPPAEQSSHGTTVAWSNSGDRLALGTSTGDVLIIDAATNQTLHTLIGHTDLVLAIDWNTSDTLIVTGSVDQSVRVWNASTGQLVRTLQGHQGVVAIASWTPDDQHVVSIDISEDPQLILWDSVTWATEIQRDEGTIIEANWSPDGQFLALANIGHAVILDSTSLNLVHAFEEPELGGQGYDIYQVAWSPNSQLLATGSLNGYVRLWEVSTGTILLTVRANESDVAQPALSLVRDIAFSSDGSQILAFSGDGTLRSWNAASGQLLLNEHIDGEIFGARFSPDRRHLAFATRSLWPVVLPVPQDDRIILSTAMPSP
jgi:WD40 repeat protein